MKYEDVPRFMYALQSQIDELQKGVIENSELLNIRMDVIEQNQVALNNKIEYIMEYLCDTVDIINSNSDMDDENADKVESLENDIETIMLRLHSLDKNINTPHDSKWCDSGTFMPIDDILKVMRGYR